MIFCFYPEKERNFKTLIELINASETREDDETFKNAVDDQFDFLNAWVNGDKPDYFFAESLDKVKTGGILALVTSAGTLDKQNEATRAMLAQQADLIGAVRLPSTAFKGNANTEVTTDIIFLQKRSEPPAELPDWVHIGQTEDGIPINKYYEQHPDMVLGEVVEGNKLYSNPCSTEESRQNPFRV